MTIDQSINTIARFLAVRDISSCTAESIVRFAKIPQVDVLMVFGNDLPEVADIACQAFRNGVAKALLFCGGTGHSTEILRQKMSHLYPEMNVSGSEAKLFSQIAVLKYKIDPSRIYLEERSTNCKENAQFGLQVLEKCGVSHQSIILMQDPTMQRRSAVSCHPYFSKDLLISYAPFIPLVDHRLHWKGSLQNLWSLERFLSLIMGEIRRLKDDENGYGPRGTGFIEHVDIPYEVQCAYEEVRKAFPQYQTR